MLEIKISVYRLLDIKVSILLRVSMCDIKISILLRVSVCLCVAIQYSAALFLASASGKAAVALGSHGREAGVGRLHPFVLG